MIKCIKYQRGIRGKTKLCGDCGGKIFRALDRYYRCKYNVVFDEYNYINGNYKKKKNN